MSLCIATAGTILAVVASSFSLSWTHSVEKTEWVEYWQVQQGRLALVSASVKGSGAGVAIPDDAVWLGDHWSYHPTLPPLASLNLAASGATVSGWTLCADGQCYQLGREAGAGISIWADEAECTERQIALNPRADLR
ncbi:MAG TPA: DUF1850 domain-containing protein [Devosia sp.]|nr:DUF1850 domain-containing protein [Devosia sp.]